MKTWRMVGIALVVGLTETAIATTVTIDDVSIQYRIPCASDPQTANLGDMTITAGSLSDGRYPMDAVFTASFSKTEPLWDCLALHWVQLIWHDDLPAKYKGVKMTGEHLPIIDPPYKGWDYMYQDGATRSIPKPEWKSDTEDTKPWYWTESEESSKYTIKQSYPFSDKPVVPTTGYTGFSTYLVAEAFDLCPHASEDCLADDEMLLLAGWDWTLNSSGITISDTFKAPSPFDVTQITTALAHGDFTDWTVVDDKMICCQVVPLPSALWAGSVLFIGILARKSEKRKAG